ncbi:MAG TPA: HIT family protein [Actinomycetota bacterium]
MSAGCAFCAIAGGELEAPVVYRSERLVAFLDHRPVFHGHTLLIPIEHHETLLDLPDDALAALALGTRLIARAVRDALAADGTFVAMNNGVSQSVPHAHVHVVPRRRKDGLRGFFWPRVAYRDAAHAEQIRATIAGRIDAPAS